VFSSPVAVAANTTYLASYHAPSGHYAEDDNSLTTAGVDNGPLHILANGVDGPNGVYANSASVVFPTSTWMAANYWIDVVFSPNAWLQTTAANFNTGTTSGTGVTNNSGGEIQLVANVLDDFPGTALSSTWTSTPWTGSGAGPTSVT